jgi:conjugal transfer ATP-binding protein TraC
VAYTLPSETRREYGLVGPFSAVQALQLTVAGVLAWRVWHAPWPVQLRAALTGCLAAAGLGAALGRWRGDGVGTWLLRACRHLASPRRASGDAAARWCGVESVRGMLVGLRGGAWLRLVEVGALDFDLKDPAEQEAVLALYRGFLNSLDFPIQVVACTEPARAVSRPARDDTLAPLAAAYDRLQAEMAGSRRVLDRRHYVALRCSGEPDDAERRLAERVAAVRRGLERMGLVVRDLPGAATLAVLRRCLGRPGRAAVDPSAYPGVPAAELAAPDGVACGPDDLFLGGVWARSLVVVGYPRQVEPGWLAGLYAFPASMRVAATIEPQDSSRAVAELTRQMQDLRATLIKADRRQGERDPYTEAALEDASALRDALARGRSKLFRYHVELTLLAPDRAELDRLTRLLETELEARLLLTRHAVFEQDRAFRATLPQGEPPVGSGRNMDSFALSTTLPFLAGELAHPGGDLWGVNLRHNSVVTVDRFSCLNAHSVTVAASGAGKSYWLKSVLTQARLRGVRVYVIDPQGEYLEWARACGGRRLRLAPGSSDRINPLALGDGPASPEARVEFARGFCQVLLGRLTPREVAMLDGALGAAYAVRPDPTLGHLLAALEAERPAADLAARLRPYVRGSLNLFDGPTTADLDADLIVFDVSELVQADRTLAPAAYFVLAEFVMRRLQASSGRSVVAVDEAHFLLGHPATARFLEGLFRAGRKLGAGISLVTQSLGDLLGEGADPDAARAARACLANAACVLLMRQQNSREAELAGRVFRLSRAEVEFLLAARRGEGLLLAGDRRAALRVEVPRELHPLFTTDPDERPRPTAAGSQGTQEGGDGGWST